MAVVGVWELSSFVFISVLKLYFILKNIKLIVFLIFCNNFNVLILKIFFFK